MDFKYFCTNGGGLCTRCRFLFLWLFSAGNAILYIIRDFPRRKDRFRGIANRISGHCGRPSGRSGDIAGDSIVLPAVRTPPVTSVRTGDTPLTSAGGKDAYRVRPHTMDRYRAGQGRNDYIYLPHDLPAAPATYNKTTPSGAGQERLHISSARPSGSTRNVQ